MNSKIVILAVLVVILVASDGKQHARLKITPSRGMGGNSFHIHINPHETVAHLKNRIRGKAKSAPGPDSRAYSSGLLGGPHAVNGAFALPIALTYRGKFLQDDKKLSAYGITHGSSIGMRPMN